GAMPIRRTACTPRPAQPHAFVRSWPWRRSRDRQTPAASCPRRALSADSRRTAVPTANPNPLTPIANRLILAPDERSLRIDLVRLDRTVQVAGCVGSRDPGRSTPTQRAAAQIPEAISVRQY